MTRTGPKGLEGMRLVRVAKKEGNLALPPVGLSECFKIGLGAAVA